MNEYQKEVDRLYKSKIVKYSRVTHEIDDELNDVLLGEAIREALAEQKFNGKK